MGGVGSGRRGGEPNLKSYKGGAKLLATMIVVQAINDWRDIIKNRDYLNKSQSPNKNLSELRLFFKSDWCKFLMMFMEITPQQILNKLEIELKEAMKMEKERKNERS